MWKLEILREGQAPEIHEGVSIVYEPHRDGIARNFSDTVVAYNAISERIRGIRSDSVMGGSIYPTFLEDSIQYSGTGGPIVDITTNVAPVQHHLIHELEGQETWELSPLPEK